MRHRSVDNGQHAGAQRQPKGCLADAARVESGQEEAEGGDGNHDAARETEQPVQSLSEARAGKRRAGNRGLSQGRRRGLRRSLRL